MFFEKKVDTRSRQKMINFLTGHFRYSTMNSWNGMSSYAHCVKFHDLGLTHDQDDKAYEMLSTDFWDEIRYPIENFTEELDGNYTIGSNGRSGGYLVLYQSHYESTGHKSHCRTCGQRNFKSALIVTDGTLDSIIVTEVVKNGGCWRTEVYLEQSVIKGICLSDAYKLSVINKALMAAKDQTIGNKCGACGTEGERGRVNYTTSPRRLVTSSKGLDQDEEFHQDDWSMSALRDRVELVRRFDQAVDEIRDSFIDLISYNEVVDEIVMVPQVRKVIQPSAASF